LPIGGSAEWLKTPFEEGRHARRLQKIAELEREIASTLCHKEHLKPPEQG
jgi:hypothetical protein